MSGRIVARPPAGHHCNPGWSSGAMVPGDPRSRYAIPPDPSGYPQGTVWECNGCGSTYVSTGPVAPNSPGFIGFRRERWWERRVREKRARNQT